MAHNTKTEEPGFREMTAIIDPSHSMESVTNKISNIPLNPVFPKSIILSGGIGLIVVGLLFTSIMWLLIQGTGIWGINQPVSWGFAIINFVWWIGIGHAGTLISAILFLFR